MSRTSAGRRPASLAATPRRPRTAATFRAISSGVALTTPSIRKGAMRARPRGGGRSPPVGPHRPLRQGPRGAAVLVLEEVRDVEVLLGVERNGCRLVHIRGEDVLIVVVQHRRQGGVFLSLRPDGLLE